LKPKKIKGAIGGYLRGDLEDRLEGCFEAKGGAFQGLWSKDYLEGRLEGCFGILKVEFKIGKMHISKLAHKCMRHENMKLVDIKKLVLVH
jgi:hypothetical protein